MALCVIIDSSEVGHRKFDVLNINVAQNFYFTDFGSCDILYYLITPFHSRHLSK